VEREWEKVLGKFTYGIYVLTTSHKDSINGMIASWVSQISYDPPLVGVAIHPNRYSHKLILEGRKFALNIVPGNCSNWLVRFKGPDPFEKFQGISWKRGSTGCPILEESIGYLECELVGHYSPGNHTLFVGKIIGGQLFRDKPPLTTLDYRGVYLGKH